MAETSRDGKPTDKLGASLLASDDAASQAGDSAPPAASSDRPDTASAPQHPSNGRDQDARPGDKPHMHNKHLGRLGEDVAARYLVSRGYDILARNWTCPSGEADIIARDDDILVFTELKTRSSTEKGQPSDAVDRRKRGKYLKIAEAFMQKYEAHDVQVRFDVMSLVVTNDAHATIRHYINAFGTEGL